MTLLFAVPMGYISLQACCNPGIRFLPPGSGGQWVLYPEQEVLHQFNHPHTQEVVFSNRFELATTQPLEVMLSVFGEPEAFLDGESLEISASPNWKDPQAVSLGTLRAGEHRLEIRVRQPHSFPALRVQSPGYLRTPGRWQAALGPEFTEPTAVLTAASSVAPGSVARILGSRKAVLTGSSNGFWRQGLIALWLLFVLGVFVVSLAHLWRHGEAKPRRAPRPSRVEYLPPVVLGLGLPLYLALGILGPGDKSVFDNRQHRDYVLHMAETRTLPRVSDGFQMYQPPLYYLTAAAVFNTAGGEQKSARGWNWVRLINPVAAWLLALWSWLLVRLVIPESRRTHWMAPLLVVVLPANLYLSPLISNELFAAALIAAGFVLFVHLSSSKTLRPWGALMIGLALGLGLLAKYTAVFAGAAITLLLLWRALLQRTRLAVLSLCSFLVGAAILAGWFYVGNLLQYGSLFLFPGSWDPASGFHYLQEPAYRTVAFYLRFGSVFLTAPEWQPWISFADGLYASFWADIFRIFQAHPGPQRYAWMELSLILAALPSAAIVLGLCETLRKAWRHLSDTVDLSLAAGTIWSVLGLMYFTLRIPFASTVKAFYLLWLVPLLALYLTRGRERIAAVNPLLARVHDLALIAYGVVSLGLLFPWGSG